MAGIASLPYPVVVELSKLLNPKDPLGNDWRCLAGKLGLTFLEVTSLERNDDPFREVFHMWSQKGKTVEDLEAALTEMNRSDCVKTIRNQHEGVNANSGDCPSIRPSLIIRHPVDDRKPPDTSQLSTAANPNISRSRSISESDPLDILIVLNEKDYEAAVFKDLIKYFDQNELKYITVHEFPGGGNVFDTFYDYLDRCTYTIFVLTSNFVEGSLNDKRHVHACEYAVEKRKETVMPVMAKGFLKDKVPKGLRGIEGLSHDSPVFKIKLQNTFKNYIKRKKKEMQKYKNQDTNGAAGNDTVDATLAPSLATMDIKDGGSEGCHTSTGVFVNAADDSGHTGDIADGTIWSQVEDSGHETIDNSTAAGNGDATQDAPGTGVSDSGNESGTSAGTNATDESGAMGDTTEVHLEKEDSMSMFKRLIKGKKKKKNYSYEYDIKAATIREPKVVPQLDSSAMIMRTTNFMSYPQETSGELSWTEQRTHTRKWTYKNALAVKGDVSVKTGIPYFAEGELKVGMENTFAVGHERWKQNTKSITKTFRVSLKTPGRKKGKAAVKVMKYEYEVPFTLTITTECDGTVIKVRKEKGVFESEYYDQETIFREENLPLKETSI